MCCRLVVAEGGEDVTIKVSDEGGGIPRSGLASIWTYLYSTAQSRVQMETLQVREGGRDRQGRGRQGRQMQLLHGAADSEQHA